MNEQDLKQETLIKTLSLLSPSEKLRKAFEALGVLKGLALSNGDLSDQADHQARMIREVLNELEDAQVLTVALAGRATAKEPDQAGATADISPETKEELKRAFEAKEGRATADAKKFAAEMEKIGRTPEAKE